MIRYVLFAALACVLLPAYSQQTFTDERVKQIAAVVEAVDHDNHTLVLRGNDNVRILTVVDPGVRNFEQINAGDRVVARYRQALVAEVVPSGTGSVSASASKTRAPEGSQPSAAAKNRVSTTVVIDAVDTSFDTITFRRPDGIVRTAAIDGEKAREFAHGLKRGDEVQITYS
jgi:hypothetical protein